MWVNLSVCVIDFTFNCIHLYSVNEPGSRRVTNSKPVKNFGYAHFSRRLPLKGHGVSTLNPAR